VATSTSEADPAGGPVVLDRIATPRGELALRRAGEHFEIISNGVFLMDSRNGESERLLVRVALDALAAGSPGHVLLGGLGIGFSLREAVASARAGRITVVEVEPAIVGWHATHLRRFTDAALADPRVEVVTADLVGWLDGTGERFDAICLDVDNGPDWTVTDGNAALYTPAGLALLRSRLRDGGVLSVWSANAAPAFADRLRDCFATLDEHQVPVQRGEPDVVYLARR
jgi:spermidine synthase